MGSILVTVLLGAGICAARQNPGSFLRQSRVPESCIDCTSTGPAGSFPEPASHLPESKRPRAPPKFEVLQHGKAAVITQEDGARWGIQDGFEGGRVFRTEDGTFHLFPSERMRLGTGQGNGSEPSDMVMQIGHWVSRSPEVPGQWQRVGTLVKSNGIYNGSSIHSSTWAGMPVWDDDSMRWHLFYVGYRMEPMDGSHAYVQFKGEIVHAVSQVPGRGGISGPYDDVGSVLTEKMPGTNSSWEGDQGDDAFFPYRLRNGTWVAFFGSALSQIPQQRKWRADWHVGLATAPSMNAKAWTKLPHLSPVQFDTAIENPIVSMTPDGEWFVAVYFPFGNGIIGYTWSKDGLTWAPGVHLQMDKTFSATGDEDEPEENPCGSGIFNTALGLVHRPDLGDEIYSVMYTGRVPSEDGSPNGFENVCHALLGDTEAVRLEYDLTRFEDDIFPKWRSMFPAAGNNSTGAYAYQALGTCGEHGGAATPCKPSVYGSADMVYAHYATNLLEEMDAPSRQQWVDSIQAFQDSQTGRFQALPGPPLPQPWHALAEATEAMFLLGGRPKYPMMDLQSLAKSRDALRRWLFDNVFNASDGWYTSASVQAPVGIIHMLGLNQSQYKDLVDEWFTELDRHVDPGSGMWFTHASDPRLPGSKSYEQLPAASAMFASFHMIHVYKCFNRDLKYPKRLVDTALYLQRHWDGLWQPGGVSSCADLDGIYIAIQASLQANRYRWADVREMCRRYMTTAAMILNDEEQILGVYTFQEGTHILHGVLFSVAECQVNFPELLIRTRRLWRRRPDACIYA